MKKNIIAAVAMLIVVATTFAQDKKAVLGLTPVTSLISEFTVTGEWGDVYVEEQDSKTGKMVRKLKFPAISPLKLADFLPSFQTILFDYFRDSNLFETVECDVNATGEENVDYILLTELQEFVLDRNGTKPNVDLSGTGYGDAECRKITVSVKLKDVKNGGKIIDLPLLGYRNGHWTQQYFAEWMTMDSYIRETEVTFGKAVVSNMEKKREKDFFLYDERKLQYVEQMVRKAIINVAYVIAPPKITAVSENGVAEFPSFWVKEKNVFLVGESVYDVVSQIVVYDIDDRIAYAKADPLDRYKNVQLQPGMRVYLTDKDGKQAVKNINKELKELKKSAKNKNKGGKK